MTQETSGAVLLKPGLSTRPFTLSRLLRPCKVALYGIQAQMALTMSGPQEGGNAQILMVGGCDGGGEVGVDAWFYPTSGYGAGVDFF
jgi:hypothetical protein